MLEGYFCSLLVSILADFGSKSVDVRFFTLFLNEAVYLYLPDRQQTNGLPVRSPVAEPRDH